MDEGRRASGARMIDVGAGVENSRDELVPQSGGVSTDVRERGPSSFISSVDGFAEISRRERGERVEVPLSSAREHLGAVRRSDP